MRLDVEIGNPPYTINGKRAYQLFINLGMNLGTDFICLITPSGWINGQGNDLDTIRDSVIHSRKLLALYIFNKSFQIFDNVAISGGVSYGLISNKVKSDKTMVVNCKVTQDYLVDNTNKSFRDLIEHSYTDINGDKQYPIITDNIASSVVNKVKSQYTENLTDWSMMRLMQPKNIFSVPTDFSGDTGDIKVYSSYARISYIDRDKIITGKNLIDKWKVVVGCLNPDRGGADNRKHRATINIPKLLEPNSICTDSYRVIGYFDTEEEANQFISYIKTKFVRYLMAATLNVRRISYTSMAFVPNDISIDTDEQLYRKYKLTDDEINHIEELMGTMK